MSIGSTRPIPGSQAVQAETELYQAQKSKTTAKTGASASAETQVSLSEAQSQLMKPGSQDLDLEKVESLKQAIRNGELVIDTGKIADALIAQSLSDPFDKG